MGYLAAIFPRNRELNISFTSACLLSWWRVALQMIKVWRGCVVRRSAALPGNISYRLLLATGNKVSSTGDL